MKRLLLAAAIICTTISCENIPLDLAPINISDFPTEFKRPYDVVKARYGNTVDYHLNTEGLTFKLNENNTVEYFDGTEYYKGYCISYNSNHLTVQLNKGGQLWINTYIASGLRMFKLQFTNYTDKDVELMTK